MTTTTPRIIKASAALPDESASFNFIDLRHRFEKYAEDVKSQCQKWIREAQNECDTIRQQAFDEGRAAGYADGMKDAKTEIEERSSLEATEKTAVALTNVIPAVQQAATLLDQQRFQFLARWETAAVQMAIELTEKLTARQIERDATVVRDRAVMALQTAAGSGEGYLHMNPEDVAALGPESGSLLLGTTYEIIADKNIERGGCLLKRPEGSVDARLSTQIDRIVEELLGPDAAQQSEDSD